MSEKQKIEPKKKIDKEIDKTFDEIEDDIDSNGKKEGDSGTKKEKTASKESTETKTNSENQQDSQNIDNTPSIVWNKYDFIPGDIVIFEDAPSAEEENGEFPSRWDLYKGATEIGEVNGENVIMFLNGGGEIVPYLKNPKEDYLPEIFTLEMDVWFEKGTNFHRYWISLKDKKNQFNTGPSDSFTIYANGIEFLDTDKRYPGTESRNWAVEPLGRWRHISIAFTKGKMKAYMDDTRLINVPHYEKNPTGITIDSENDNMYVKNIRIAKGGVKYYDRFLSDGKIIVNGIKFDVNKATLKPESMGPINKIYKLMLKNTEVNFSVEGHTDTDGSKEANQILSVARAKTVMNKLIEMGIDKTRLKFTGFGENKPLDNNITPEGKANNRRVEFVKF